MRAGHAEDRSTPISAAHAALDDGSQVDVQRSVFARARSWLREFVAGWRRPYLHEKLPPLPPRRSDGTRVGGVDPAERGEFLLQEIMRAPPEYVDAALIIARATQMLRSRGDDVYIEGRVAFVLSRMHADADGTTSMTRLRDLLYDVPFGKTLWPALLRLEEQGVVELLTTADTAPLSGLLDASAARVRLLVKA